MFLRRTVYSLLVVLGCAACDKEDESATHEKASGTDAGSPKQTAIDPKLAEAVAQVAEAPARAAPTGGGLNEAPPEKGVFEPGEADKHIAPGAPAKLTLGSKGGGKRVSLGAVIPGPKYERQVALQLSVQTGPRSALPTMDLIVDLKSKAPPEKASDTEASSVDMMGRVTSAKLAAEQPGRLPPGVDEEIRKLTGSRIRFTISPTGKARGIESEAPKGIDEGGLGRAVRSAAELFSSLYLPYPREPVGPGAYWMVSSRESFSGLDVLVYRMVRVESVDDDRVTLSLNTKRYVAGGQIDFPGLPPHEIDQFKGEGEGRLVVKTAPAHLVEAELTEGMLASLIPQGDPGRRLSLQFEVNGKVQVAGGG